MTKEEFMNNRIKGKFRMQAEEIFKDLNDCLNQAKAEKDIEALRRKLIRVMDYHIAKIKNIYEGGAHGTKNIHI